MRLWHWLVLALAARLAVAGLQLAHPQPWRVPLQGHTWGVAGTDGYLQLGHCLWHHGQYAFEPDGPPALHRLPVAAVVYLPAAAWMGQWWWGVLGINLLLAAALLWAIYETAHRLRFGPMASQLACGLVALHPQLLGQVLAATAVQPGALLACLSLLAWLRWHQCPRWGRAVGLGLVLAAAALVHPVLWPLPAGLLLWGLWQRRAALAVALLLTVVGSWALWRHQQGMGLGLASGGGYQLWVAMGNRQGNPHGPETAYAAATGRALHSHHFGPVSLNDERLLLRLALQQGKNNPAEAVEQTAEGLFRFWVPAWGRSPWAWVQGLNLVLVGLWLWPRRLRDAILPDAWLAGSWLLAAPWWPVTGYYALVLPLLVLLALRPASVQHHHFLRRQAR